MSHLLKEIAATASEDFLKSTLDSLPLSRTRSCQKRSSGDPSLPSTPTPGTESPIASSANPTTPTVLNKTIDQKSMSSQRSRAPRGGARTSGHDAGEEAQLWAEIQEQILKINKTESRQKEVGKEIVESEIKIKAAGGKVPVEVIDALGDLYRENVRLSEQMKALVEGVDGDGVMQKCQILKAMKQHTEEAMEASLGRTSLSHTRSALDVDGSADSPVPSPAENKHMRKLGTTRTSSQPPKEKEAPVKQENNDAPEPIVSKTKVTFAIGAEVAFKRKLPGQTEEYDWIQGIVVKVIGDGKSRRYDVQDPFPDDVSKGAGEIYRSSASSMVPVPPLGTSLADYEPGKRVLALYPKTSTFYRAEVKGTLEGGAKVDLLFEDEESGELRPMDRRFVLDYKG